MLVDAMQPVYHKIVYIKQVKMHDQESHIALMLSSYTSGHRYTIATQSYGDGIFECLG